MRMLDIANFPISRGFNERRNVSWHWSQSINTMTHYSSNPYWSHLFRGRLYSSSWNRESSWSWEWLTFSQKSVGSLMLWISQEEYLTRGKRTFWNLHAFLKASGILGPGALICLEQQAGVDCCSFRSGIIETTKALLSEQVGGKMVILRKTIVPGDSSLGVGYTYSRIVAFGFSRSWNKGVIWSGAWRTNYPLSCAIIGISWSKIWSSRGPKYDN